MYYNAKTLVSALLAKNQFEKLICLLNLDSSVKFWKNYQENV